MKYYAMQSASICMDACTGNLRSMYEFTCTSKLGRLEESATLNVQPLLP